MIRVLTRPLALLVLLVAATATAGVINVPGDYSLIQDAVMAAASGDTVLVAAGTYHDCTHETEGPGTTPACVIMRSGVTLRGVSQSGTVIDAEGLGRGIFVQNVANCRIENLTVTGAFADVYGAGILVRRVGDTVTMTDVTIDQNLDGGIICTSHADPVLTRVTFTQNVAKQGGGLSIEDTSSVQVIDCIVDDNSAPSAAGVFVRNQSVATLTGCQIIDNVGTAPNSNCGGLFVNEAEIHMSDCLVAGNVSLGNGGGIAMSATSGEIANSVISGNTCSSPFTKGGGLACEQSSVTLRNLLIANNAVTGLSGKGGGIDVSFSPSPTIEHCTIVGNSCEASGSGGGISCQLGASPTLTNCIIAGSPVGEAMVCLIAANPTVTGCDLWGNAGGDAICGTDGGCNFSADPVFCGTTGHEYNIQPGSPCAAGNHPDGGACGASYCGAYAVGCGDVGVEDLPDPAGLVLGNAPNPFNPLTSIYFILDAPGDAVLGIYDLRGHALRTFHFSQVRAGQRHEIVWNGKDDAGLDLPSGVYLYRLQANGLTTSKRMSLIR